MNSVKYLLFYMELFNCLFCDMFGSILECYDLTGVSLLWTRRALANKASIGLIVNFRGYFDLLEIQALLISLIIYSGLLFT